MHPFHPDSPEYPAMVEAGRVERTYRRITGCTYPSFDYDDGRPCGEPLAGTMQRTDVAAPLLRACRDHLTEHAKSAAAHSYPLHVKYACSVCGDPVDAGYRLDDSGRCTQCQP